VYIKAIVLQASILQLDGDRHDSAVFPANRLNALNTQLSNSYQAVNAVW
jgi:hypothetical protein